MAREVLLSDAKAVAALKATLSKVIQSAYLNFLLGAGASHPGLPIAGAVEKEILQALNAGNAAEADHLTAQFLRAFAEPMRALLAGEKVEAVDATLSSYVSFVRALDAILAERKSKIMPRQATIFTTNYDLFFERASEECKSVILNDGFNRLPNLQQRYAFQSEKLFDATHHTGNYYDYTAELPSINLVKLHGSMTWARDARDVIFDVLDFDALGSLDLEDAEAVRTYLESVAIVLPTQRKLLQTTLDRLYYDLLRIFANALERENTLLISFGFSFDDDHVFDIVKRGLRNPTLLLMLFCYDPAEVSKQRERFAGFHNVTLVFPENAGDLTFATLNDLLLDVVPGQEQSENAAS